jgi:RHS repeat-associated protein
MKRIRNYRVLRPVAGLLAGVTLLLWTAPPAAALRKPEELRPKDWKTQTPDAVQRRQIAEKAEAARKAAAKHRPDERELSASEMAAVRGRGQYRERAFCGVLPWQRSFRDVNLSNGNLFKSFSDIQVSPARGAGLAWQRTYNSSDDRVGPFGVGWTHAYDIRMEEAGNNNVERMDFFGGEHTYHRDADGLYSPPPYLHDELSSEYLNTLADGPPQVASDTQVGMDGTVKHFFANGSERACDYIEDRHGNRTVLTYGLEIGGGRKLLTRVTDPSARYLEISWTNLGTQAQPAWRITQVQGPLDPDTGNPVYTVAYEYNAEFNLWKVRQDPSGLNRTTTFTYTTVQGESGLLASISDSLNHTVSYTYTIPSFSTNKLWVDSVTEPASGGVLTWLIEPRTNGFTGSGGTGAIVSSVGGASPAMDFLIGFDPYLRVEHIAPMTLVASTRAYEFDYDSQHNVTRQYTWAATPAVDGTAWNGRAHSTAVARTYGPHGHVLTEYQEGYQATTTTTSTYFPASKYFQKETVTDPLGRVTRMDYFDNADPSAGNRGNVKWVRDARYSVTGRQFEYSYNSYGQKASELSLNQVLTQYSYEDLWGNLTRVVQDPGAGRLNRTTTMAYDVAGRVKQSTDPKAQISSFNYNALGQPLQAHLPGETVSYTYGANGRTESVTDNRGTTTLAYETGNDRVASVTDPVTGTVSYTYALEGHRLTTTLPGGGTWTYSYREPEGQTWCVLPDPGSLDTIRPMLKKITDDQGREVKVSLDTTGRLHEVLSNITYSGASPVSYQHTLYSLDTPTTMLSARYAPYSRGLLLQVKNTWNWYGSPAPGAPEQWNQQVLVQNDYTYSNTGNRLTNQVSDAAGPIRTEQYGYDELSRLTSVNYGDGESQGYAFDPMGNRLSKTVNGVTESYTYNPANMLLTRGASSYTNDSNGNTLTGGGRTNTWDGQNRLIECTFGTTTTSHTYGTDGLRRRTVQGTNTTDFVLDGQNVVRTFLNGQLDKTYLHGPRGPEYERAGSNAPVWYLYDGLGSVLGTVREDGTFESTRKYDVYGAVRSSTGGSGTKHKFVGSLGHPDEEETGLIYMRARWMDPVTGRFVSEDPAQDGNNWFSYAEGRPTVLRDPDGKTSQAETGAATTLNTILQEGLAMGPFQALRFARSMIAALEQMQVAYAAFAGAVTQSQMERILTNMAANQSTIRLYRAAEVIFNLWMEAL